jgi:DNA-binding response OmpR family regulator
MDVPPFDDQLRKPQEMEPALRSQLVLVVDDEPEVRSVLTEILAAAGYDVIVACDGEEALEAVRTHAPGLMITDLVMPRKEGLETIREARQLAPGMKIIAISGAFGNRFLTVATHLGAHAALAKPFSADVLLSTIRGVRVNG